MEPFLAGLAIVIGVPLAIWLAFAFVATLPLWIGLGVIAGGIAIGGAGGAGAVALGIVVLIVVAIIVASIVGGV